ncbi:hypothetical protein PLANPX_5768 [Lacipirellula parvula]|uniref:Uncharacterized protein n=1 Tax=Lacipirellula parvula TaxID=2650471 RepID=A0A5K7XMQ3_9BACT|nr:hypothetical protein PLANPX_5768 [Lacipirellula parvula]
MRVDATSARIERPSHSSAESNATATNISPRHHWHPQRLNSAAIR